MNHYEILKDCGRGTFQQRLFELMLRLKTYLEREVEQGRGHVTYMKVFLSDISNQEPQLMADGYFRLLAREVPVTVIGQPPVDGSKIVVLVRTSDAQPEFRFDALRLHAEDVEGRDAYQQTLLLFERYISMLSECGLNIADHCQRTWIYVSNIDRNYADVVRARNEVFARHGLTADTHYIASTGIGGRTAVRHSSVAIDFLTFPDIEQSQVRYLNALDHLNKTHEYGVAFERATMLSLHNCRRTYISGTASINNKGEVIFLGDVERQCERLIENISALLADGSESISNARYFIVYLRDISDYVCVNRFMQSRFPQIPYVIVMAKVCRPEWLVEMECVVESEL